MELGWYSTDFQISFNCVHMYWVVTIQESLLEKWNVCFSPVLQKEYGSALLARPWLINYWSFSFWVFEACFWDIFVFTFFPMSFPEAPADGSAQPRASWAVVLLQPPKKIVSSPVSEGLSRGKGKPESEPKVLENSLLSPNFCHCVCVSLLAFFPWALYGIHFF